jgi:hypothetical protein
METTSFDVAGTQDQVADFLRVITSGLHDPPPERLLAERHLLKVESQRRGGVFDELASVRHGARGQGLSAYLEFGLEHLETEDLRKWARTWFTADNAVLWLWGGDPHELNLALPRGQWCALPPVQSRPLPPRSWITWGDSGASLTFLANADRGTANATAWWLQRYLNKALRHDAGLAYTVHVQQRQVGDARLFAVGVDGAPDRAQELRDALLAALEALDTVHVAEEELAAWRQETNEMLLSTERGAELGRLDLAATGLLLDGHLVRPEQVVEQCAAVTSASVASVIRNWYDTCLLAVPQNMVMPPTWNGVRRHSEHSVRGGRVFAPAIRALQGHRLLVAPEGITVEASRDIRWTVRWDDCAVVLKHADGSLTAIGSDGVAVQLLPGDWAGGQQLLADVFRRLEPSVVVPVSTRPSDQVVTGLRGMATWSTVVLGFVVSLFWFIALTTLLVPDPEATQGIDVTMLIAVVLAGCVTWPLVVRLRATKERRALPKEPSPTAIRFNQWLAQQEPATLPRLEVLGWMLALVLTAAIFVVEVALWLAIVAAFATRHLRKQRRHGIARVAPTPLPPPPPPRRTPATASERPTVPSRSNDYFTS